MPAPDMKCGDLLEVINDRGGQFTLGDKCRAVSDPFETSRDSWRINIDPDPERYTGGRWCTRFRVVEPERGPW